MSNQDMAGRIMAHAFHDEMQKIAGPPRAVLEGGGGALGRLLRAKKGAGRLSGRLQGRAEQQLARNPYKKGTRESLEEHWRTGGAADNYDKAEKMQRAGYSIRDDVNKALGLSRGEGWLRSILGQPMHRLGGGRPG